MVATHQEGGKVLVTCLKCNKQFKTTTYRLENDRGKYCSRLCCDLAKKGKHFSPKTEIKKGQHLSSSTEFCIGHIAWNKNKRWIEMEWENHPNFKGGSQSYRRHVRRNPVMFPLVCEKCGKGVDKKLNIHHKDNNRNNNKMDNLQILCSMCHTHIHKNWEKIGRKELSHV